MISLDYTTDNPRWGKSGILFTDLLEYARTLGFLSNIKHYNRYGENTTYFENSISIHIEGNHVDGAWAKECRIHYYKDIKILKKFLPDLWKASSAGRGNVIECRINSNRYINHLIADYNFSVYNTGYSSDVYPNKYEKILYRLNSQLKGKLSKEDVISIINQFNFGYNL